MIATGGEDGNVRVWVPSQDMEKLKKSLIPVPAITSYINSGGAEEI